MEYTYRRTRRIAATAPIYIALLLSGCGGGGTLDLSGITNPVTTCDNGAANYTPISSPVTAIAAAARISFAITDDGSLWAWGSNINGQLGAGTTTNSVNPLKIGVKFATVSAGYGHSLALKTDGTLWAWGNNSFGQLGDGTTTSRTVPVQIGSDTYQAVSAGLNFSLAIKSDGTLWAWGDNSFEQLGFGDNSPAYSTVPVQIGSDTYQAVSAGTGHALALKSDGSLWAWGDNNHGELGDGCSVDTTSGQTVCTNKNVPEAIDSGSSYAAIASGYFYSLAIKTDGSLWAWGDNAQADLGTGDSKAVYLVPTHIGDGYSPVAAALSASKFSVLGNTTVYYHSLALKGDGSLWAWGDNTFGQIGDNSRTPVSAPKQLLAGSGDIFTAVSAGDGDHSLAIKSDGSLWAWGSNSCGQLGNGNNNTSYVPIQVSK
jgi:alpha-tubulin suppressor-like RCC1 family protein